MSNIYLHTYYLSTALLEKVRKFSLGKKKRKPLLFLLLSQTYTPAMQGRANVGLQ